MRDASAAEKSSDRMGADEAWEWARRVAESEALPLGGSIRNEQHGEIVRLCALLAASAPAPREASRVHAELERAIVRHFHDEEGSCAGTEKSKSAPHRREHGSIQRSISVLSGLVGGDPSDLEAGARDAVVLLLDHFVRWDEVDPKAGATPNPHPS